MDRRTLFSTFSITKRNRLTQVKTPHATISSGLDPYTGSWDYSQARHLLSRTLFGPTHDNIITSINNGLAGTLNQLFMVRTKPAPPVHLYYDLDLNVPAGTTWVDKAYSTGALKFDQIEARTLSLLSWQAELFLDETISLREKMTLFWLNHFGIQREVVTDPKFVYRHQALCRQYAWGNVKDLVKEITIDPCMLRFLNGNSSNKNAPNENFARELLELFTIGRGPLIAPGDYSNYTEQDIVSISKSMTGWVDYNYQNSSFGDIGSSFQSARHDKTTKTLSAHFGQATISNGEDNEYKQVIDIIFQQAETARHICRKVYRWFVYYEIDDTIETTIIAPMASLLIQSNFEIEPVLRKLLSSQHFFDMASIGPMIKNPIDFTLSLKQLHLNLPSDNEARGKALELIMGVTILFGMGLYQPPSVAGWPAYYQSPTFYRSWINAHTLKERQQIMSFALSTGIQGATTDNLWIDIDAILQDINNPAQAQAVVNHLAALLCPVPLTAKQLEFLKNALVDNNGNPDILWPFVYNNYSNNPTAQNVNLVRSAIYLLLNAISELAEFQLS